MFVIIIQNFLINKLFFDATLMHIVDIKLQMMFKIKAI